MAAFRPALYTAKELKGLNPSKRRALKKEIVKHLHAHPQIRKILRQKTSPTLKKLKAK
jgi:hypothetical protein